MNETEVHQVTIIEIEQALQRVERGESNIDDANLLRSVITLVKYGCPKCRGDITSIFFPEHELYPTHTP